jgi:hypothetical protein
VNCNFNIFLNRPLRLNTGQSIETVLDALLLIGELPYFPNVSPALETACELLCHAARTRSPVDMELAGCELALALADQGLFDVSVRAPPGSWAARLIAFSRSRPPVPSDEGPPSRLI